MHAEFYKSLSSIAKLKLKLKIWNNEIPEITSVEIRSGLNRNEKQRSSGRIQNLGAFKAATAELIPDLNTLFSKCLEGGKIPKYWSNALTVVIYKKRNPTHLEYYKPISS